MVNKVLIENLVTENGVQIQLTQSDGFDTMINATEMGKLFGSKNTQPDRWLRSKEAKDLINTFKSVPQLMGYTPVMTIRGNYSDGTRQGTWMHRIIAIQYAQWLNPEFAIWVSCKIDELLRNGFTTALQEERDRYNTLLPKAQYCDEVLTYSDITYTTEELCKDLCFGFGPSTLLKKLEKEGYVYRRGNGRWLLHSNLGKYGYVRTVSDIVIDKNTGKKKTINKTRWTESGKYWIWSLSKTLKED